MQFFFRPLALSHIRTHTTPHHTTPQNQTINQAEDNQLEAEATLKQCSLDLQLALLRAPPTASLSPPQKLRLATQSLTTAQLWCQIERWEIADDVITKSLSYFSLQNETTDDTAPHAAPKDMLFATHFQLLLVRLRVCIRLDQQLPCRSVLQNLSSLATFSTVCALDFLVMLINEGEYLLVEAEKCEFAICILQSAHELCTKNSLILSAAEVLDDVAILGQRILILLAWALLSSTSQHTHTVNVFSIIQTLASAQARCAITASTMTTTDADDPDPTIPSTVLLLTFCALLKNQQYKASQDALIQAIQHEGSTYSCCIFAVKKALTGWQGGGGASAGAALQAAVAEIQHRQGDYDALNDISALADVLYGALEEVHDGAMLDAVLEMIEAGVEGVGVDGDGMAVDDTAGTKTTTMMMRMMRMRKALFCLRVLCWNKGCHLISNADEASSYRRAARFFHAFLLMMTGTTKQAREQEEGEGEGEGEEEKYNAMLALALCHGALGEYEQSMQYLDACLEEKKNRVDKKKEMLLFLKTKLCLSSMSVDRAMETVQRMSDDDALKVVCCEALEQGDGAEGVAMAAMQRLLDVVRIDTSTVRQRCTIYQNLIRLLLLSHEKMNASNGGARREMDDTYGRVAVMMEAVVQEVQAVHCAESDMGLLDTKVCHWFCITSWNAALSCMKDTPGTTTKGVVASLMACCGEMYAFLLSHFMHDDRDLSFAQRAQVRERRSLLAAK